MVNANPSALWSRRQFLAASSGAAIVSSQALSAADSSRNQVAFFLIGDTHYYADEKEPSQLDPRSKQVTSALIHTLKNLPGSEIPEQAGGGVVLAPQGVVHAGDIIDSGDKNGPLYSQMQQTEWQAYCDDFGIRGLGDGLNCPVYEVHGNHDGPQATGLAIDGIAQRNRERKAQGLGNISTNGLMVSWDWGDIHFINLGIVVGRQLADKPKRRYAPTESLDFLEEDLRRNVGSSGRPVVLVHHIDLARYSVACDESDPDNRHREWHPCDIQAFYQVLQKYRIAALLHGHTHVRDIYRWEGTTKKGTTGFNVFNVDNASHFKSDAQAFLYFEVFENHLYVRECATHDAWKTHFWTAQVWDKNF